jgi:two-component system NtrC family response regulator
MARKRVLVVDDEKNMRSVLKLLFEGAGLETDCVDDGAAALARIDSGEAYGVIVSDLKMDGLDGMGLLRGLRERGIAIPFILITAYGSVEKAVEAMKLGAVDVLTKPFAKDALLSMVNRILAIERLEDENAILKAGSNGKALIYRSRQMAEIVELVRRIGPSTMPVLLTGESGTGKEVLARSIHEAYCGGDFSAKPFVSLNCPAVPESLLESELFGYRRGAFTGANADFKGRVELADGGTLFFDEIGDLPLVIQPKLLRLLEDRSFEPLGSGKTRKVDLRIICASNRNLTKLVAEGRFREDLLYRINAFMIEIPALRERNEDVEPLASYFMARYAKEMRKDIHGIERSAVDLLVSYRWPGNVRELRNVIERAVVLCSGKKITETDLPKEIRCPDSSICLEKPRTGNAIEMLERSLIEDAMKKAAGNISGAARILGITRNTLRYRLKKYGIFEE